MIGREGPATANNSPTAEDGPGNPAELCAAGLMHLRAEQYLDAQLCCERALAIDSNYADALHLMGLLSIQTRQYDHAAEWVSRAVRQAPKLDYLVTLGIALQSQGQFEQSLEVFDKALQLRPEAVELWRRRGNLLLELKRPAEALSSFQRLLKLNPRHWEAAFNSGILLHDEGRLEEAVACFTLCDELEPNHAPTLSARGRSLGRLKRYNEALADNMRAHALDPSDAGNCSNIGGLLQSLQRDEEALPWLEKALHLRPDHVDALRNKAVWLSDHHRFDEAFAIYERLKVLDSGNARTEWNLSLLQLLTGNFAAGWAGREARWKAPGLSLARFETSQPLWLGEAPIDGKTIAVPFDEGLGDTIQFSRYVPLLAARGARVILVVQQALCSLLSELPGVSECVAMSKGLPPCDMYCPIASLPLAFGTRLEIIPVAQSYLPAPAKARVQAWEDRLGPHDRLRVGLVWSGNSGNTNDRNRSLPLRQLLPLLDLEATFVSLQKDVRPDDKAVLLERTDILDLTAYLDDFRDTAALIACLDLVITVDTSVAHLAGALGCSTWIMLPYVPDYRWLLDRDDSPWYPSVRLFRQSRTRDYAEVVRRVRAELMLKFADAPA